MTPALGARTSIVTLSVSICAMVSSSATASLGPLAMPAMVPAPGRRTSDYTTLPRIRLSQTGHASPSYTSRHVPEHCTRLPPLR